VCYLQPPHLEKDLARFFREWSGEVEALAKRTKESGIKEDLLGRLGEFVDESLLGALRTQQILGYA